MEFEGEWNLEGLEEWENKNIDESLENLNFELQQEIIEVETLNTIKDEDNIEVTIHEDYESLMENNLEAEEFSFPDEISINSNFDQELNQSLDYANLHPDYENITQIEVELPVLSEGKVNKEIINNELQIVTLNSDSNDFDIIHEDYQNLEFDDDNSIELDDIDPTIEIENAENDIAIVTPSFESLNPIETQSENELIFPDEINQLNPNSQNTDGEILNLENVAEINLNEPQVIIKEKEVVFTPIHDNYNNISFNNHQNINGDDTVTWLEAESLSNDNLIEFNDIKLNNNTIQWMDVRLNDIINFNNLITPQTFAEDTQLTSIETNVNENNLNEIAVNFNNLITPQTFAEDTQLTSVETNVNENNLNEIAVNFNNLITPQTFAEDTQLTSVETNVNENNLNEIAVNFNNLITPQTFAEDTQLTSIETNVNENNLNEIAVNFNNLITPQTFSEDTQLTSVETNVNENNLNEIAVNFNNLITPQTFAEDTQLTSVETNVSENNLNEIAVNFNNLITPQTFAEDTQLTSVETNVNENNLNEIAVNFNNLITPQTFAEDTQLTSVETNVNENNLNEIAVNFNNLITPQTFSEDTQLTSVETNVNENNLNEIAVNFNNLITPQTFADETINEENELDNHQNTTRALINFNNIRFPTEESEEIAQSTSRRVTINGATSSTNTETTNTNTEITNNEETITQGINNQSSSLNILHPTLGTLLDTRDSSVIIEFPLGAEVELKINGVSVDSSLVGRTEDNAANQTTNQTWYGVIFEEGENTLTLEGKLNGTTLTPISIPVEVRGAANEITLRTVQARIPADGRSTATIRGQLLDEQGNVSNRQPIVTLDASAGQFIGVDQNPDLAGFQVEAKQGEFTAELRSGIDAQTVRINAQTQGLEASTQMQFITALRRQTLLTGVFDLRWGARGSDFYDSFRDFLPADENFENEVDLSSAFFAQGAIGEWEYTGAFNSDRSLNRSPEGNNRLFRNYEASELAYPLYGDSSSVEVITPSTDQVYFRLERTSPVDGADPDYFLWGDYNTQEFSTASQEFSATSRQLHGFKTNYNFSNLQVTGFYATNIEGFQRDTIAPDGTSGFYFLSRRLVIPGSEEVYLEIQDYNSPGRIIDRQRLARGADYDIDYDRGTLLFNSPIFRTDIDENGDLLVRQILVTYQYDNLGEEDTSLIGGRLVYHLNRDINQQTYLGATYLFEDKGTRDFELYGADLLFNLGNGNSLIAEYAHSNNDSEFSGFVEGNAYRVELNAQPFNGLSLNAFYRSAEEGFANQATSSFVPGQTRYGAEALARLTPTTNFRVRYEHEDNFGVAPRPLDDITEFFDVSSEPLPGSLQDNSLTTVSLGLQQRIGSASLDLDWIFRDRIDRRSPNALQTDSSQLRTRFILPISNTLSVQAFNETTVTAEQDAVFSDRTGIGLSWQIVNGVNLNLNQQWFTAGPQEGQSITNIGLDSAISLGSDTTINARYGIVNGINGATGQGTLGIDQKWAITPGLRVDLGYEHLFSNLFTRTASGTQFAQPSSTGQGSSSLGSSGGDTYTIGIEYVDSPAFKASTRFQHRNSSGGSNTVLSASATGNITPSLTALFTYNQASSSNQVLQGIGTTRTLRTGLAYRDPWDDTWNGLLRYEYRENPSTIPDTILFGRGTGSTEHLFSAEAIYAPSWQWEFYGKYAFRNSTTFLANDFIGSTNVSLGQLRAVYRMNYNTELVAEGRLISQPSAGFTETGLLLEAGYYLTPDLRLSAGYAFGEIDDRDFSGFSFFWWCIFWFSI